MYQRRMHIHTTFISLPIECNCLINELKWATQKDVIRMFYSYSTHNCINLYDLKIHQVLFINLTKNASLYIIKG